MLFAIGTIDGEKFGSDNVTTILQRGDWKFEAEKVQTPTMHLKHWRWKTVPRARTNAPCMGSPQEEHNLRRSGSLLLETKATRKERGGLGERSWCKGETVTHETKVELLEVKMEGVGRLSEVGCEDPDAPLSCLVDLPKCSDEA